MAAYACGVEIVTVVAATCRDFWGGATVVRGYLYEGGI